MDKFLEVIKSIDWIFACIILIGGRYWGMKFFRISKHAARNFLGFATAWGIVWLIIKHYAVGLEKTEAVNLLITYLFVTSFYELLAKQLFEKIEGLFTKKEVPTTQITIEKGEVTEIKEVKPEEKTD